MLQLLLTFVATLAQVAGPPDEAPWAVACHATAPDVLFVVEGEQTFVVTACGSGDIAVHAFPSLDLIARTRVADPVDWHVTGTHLSIALRDETRLTLPIPALRPLENPKSDESETLVRVSRTPVRGNRWESIAGKRCLALSRAYSTVHEETLVAVAIGSRRPRLFLDGDPPTELEWKCRGGGHLSEILDIAFTRRGMVTTSWDGTMRTWDDEGRCTGYRDDVPPLARVAAAGDDLVGCDTEGRLWFIPSTDGAVSSRAFGGGLMAALVGPDGQIHTGSTDNVLRSFTRSGEVISSLAHGAAITALAYDACGRVRSADARGFTMISEEDSHESRPGLIVPSPVNALAMGATFEAIGQRDGTVTISDASSHKVRAVYRHENDVKALAFDATGRRLASTADDGLIMIWSSDAGAKVLGRHPRAGHSVHFSPSGKFLASGCLDGYVRVFDVTSGEVVAALGPFAGGVNTARYDPEGKRLVIAASSGATMIVDAESGKRLGQPHVHDMAAVTAEFVDADHVFAAHTDGTLIVFDWASGEVIRRAGRTAPAVIDLMALGGGNLGITLAGGAHWTWHRESCRIEPSQRPFGKTSRAVDDSFTLRFGEDDVVAYEGKDGVRWIRCLPGHERRAVRLGDRLAMAAENGTVLLLDQATGRVDSIITVRAAP